MAELLTDTKEVRESIRELLFTECGEEVQEDLLAWEELDPYLEELCSFGVERLSREPDVLAGEYSRIQKQLQDVACSNYRALIDSFESSGSVSLDCKRLTDPCRPGYRTELVLLVNRSSLSRFAMGSLMSKYISKACRKQPQSCQMQ